MKGKFITFEGCEGVGKSSQLNLLIKYLEEKGVSFCFTREPGGTKISEDIRNIIDQVRYAPSFGKFNVYNLACATLICLSLGKTMEDLIPNVSKIKVSGRLEMVKPRAGQKFYVSK